MKTIKNVVANVAYIIRCGGSLGVVVSYLFTLFIYLANYSRYNVSRADFRRKLVGKYGNDWFSNNVPYWEACVFGALKGRPVHALEIGSWEGMSAFFMLSSLPNLELACVDTWRGSDEHYQLDARRIEERFDYNLKSFAARVRKYKCSSLEYFSSVDLTSTYDLIYIDGSHYVRDVMSDAVHCFDLLKIGGFLIFDDYLWRFYKERSSNPAAAINMFLRLYNGKLELISVNYQVIIRRIH